MHPDAGTRASFFPKADATVLHTKYVPPSPALRPSEAGPILDPDNANKALDAWSADVANEVYPENPDVWNPEPIPDAKVAESCLADRYLFPILTPNERLRLTMFYYYTRGTLEDEELVSRLQEKVHLAKEIVDWEFAIIGFLNHNEYTRVCTVGLPLAVLPRRESTCAHTVNQPPGKVFKSVNMAKDWRFSKSPHVEHSGIRAYAGVPIRFETEFGQHVAFGALCVASKTEQPPLSRPQQLSLARLADWIVADIVHSARARRLRERRTMTELMSTAQKLIDTDDDFVGIVRDMLQNVYPGASISIHKPLDGQLVLEGGTKVSVEQIEHGLWEDSEHFDYLIEKYNHLDPVADRVVRIIAAQCASQRIPTWLIVGTKDFRLVFDDVDSSFVHMASQMLCRGWQNLALREALNAKENFLRGITHELRTPIHGILGSVELLSEELGMQDATSPDAEPWTAASYAHRENRDPNNYIRTIRNSARELISTVNSLISLNRWTEIAQKERIVAPHHINEIEAMLLNELVQASTEQSATRLSIMLKHHLPPGLDTLTLDIRLFVDCIQPIIINAIQHTDCGIVCITISVSSDQQSLIVDVEDTGCGIRPVDRDNIFRAFEKVDLYATGAGLGLTLARKLATIMNGEVMLVKSEVGKGSHFRATFAHPTCAGSSLPADRSLRIGGRPVLLFYTPFLPEETSLSSHFARYLLHHGHIQSINPDGSISIFDYSIDLPSQQQTLKGKPAICLLPDSAHVMMNDDRQIRREANVVYVKGPFLSNVLEEALDQAHAIQMELETGNKIPEVKISIEEITEVSPLVTTTNGSPTASTPPTSTDETIDSLKISLKILHIEAPAPAAVRKVAKPTTLLVDDNSVNLRFLEMYCRRRTIPHLSATDGVKAVQSFSAHQASAFQPIQSNDPIKPCNDHASLSDYLAKLPNNPSNTFNNPANPSNTPANPSNNSTDMSDNPAHPSNPPANLSDNSSKLYDDPAYPPKDPAGRQAASPIPVPIELILMDLQMPNCDGIEATRQIRALEQQNGWRKSVIVMVTGQDSLADRTGSMKAGADAFFVKPVGPKVLDKGIREWFPDKGS